MENHEVLLGQNSSGALGHNQPVVLNRNHSLAIGQNHGLEMGQTHDQEARLGQTHDDHEFEPENGLAMEEKPEHQVQDVHLHGGNSELDMPDHNELTVSESQELDENMELAVIQHEDMGLDSVHDMSLHQALVVTTSPVLQQRTLAISPTYELHVGQEFPDVKACRRALRDTAIALHFEMQTIKSDKTRFTAKCASEGCPWRIHAAKLPGVPTFTIRTINESHSCGGIAHLGHQQASVQWVANSVEQRLRENPNYKPKEILEEIHRVHGITLSYKQAWRGKERIMAAMRGSFEEGYRLLPQYCEQVKRTNPGSIASVYGNATDNCFQHLFISFQASIYGFLNACRPLLGLDRTFLKSKYLGTLLLAIGFDGDGGLFPLAFGVVDEENEDNWMWFLSELHNLLEVNTENMPRLTILSDRQKGIVDGVEANFPTAFHGFCMRNLSESFRKEFNNTILVNLLWDAAHALTVIEFEAKILEIEEISQDAAYWIRRIPPRLWATAYFEGTRFGHLTANIVESLNSWILEASGLPIIQMMECIRRQLMTWFNRVVDVPLAQTGEGIAECELLKWFVQEGDQVEEFQPLCEVQSDKATMEITSRYRGKVFKALHAPGNIVKVGETLLKMVIDEDASSNQCLEASEVIKDSNSSIGDSYVADSGSNLGIRKTNIGGVLSTPAVRNFAKQLGVNIEDVNGTGQEGRVLKEDVLHYASHAGILVERSASFNASSAEQYLEGGQKSPELSSTYQWEHEDRVIPLRGFQRAMFKSMTLAAKIPHFHYVDEINCNSLGELKASFQNVNSDPGVKYTFLPVLIKSLSMALIKCPMLNSCFNEELQEVTLKGSHNIGIAMATPNGLVVPNIKKVQCLSIMEITKELSRLQELALANKLSSDDISGGTITLSNIGAIGGKFGSPLINLPEISIIALGRIQTIPQFDEDGNVYPASIMTVNIGADHRVLDGATVAKFCNEWKLFIEKPELLMLHMR